MSKASVDKYSSDDSNVNKKSTKKERVLKLTELITQIEDLYISCKKIQDAARKGALPGPELKKEEKEKYRPDENIEGHNLEAKCNMAYTRLKQDITDGLTHINEVTKL